MGNTRRIIGLVGPAGCGKTSAALGLVDYRFTRHRFAGPLKAMLHCIGLTPEHTDGALKEEPCELLGGKTPRWAMQSLGTEWGRELITPDIWINAWQATLPEGDVIVDDCRFPNEAKAIKSLGGALVRIERPGYGHATTHESEAHELPAIATVVNSGTINDMVFTLSHKIVTLFE